MNYFKIIILDSVLLLFPIIIYLLYLSTNKKIKNKNIYNILSLFSSFYLLYRYNINIYSTILIINSIILISFLENKYILASIFGVLVIILYMNNINNTYLLVLIYILGLILYILYSGKKISNVMFIILFIISSSLIYSIVMYKYNNFFNINIILSYIFITIIMLYMCGMGKKILRVHLNYKELQNEKQIRLSLFKITHEIKNPIAVCKGYLDMLDTNNQKQVTKYIPIIKSEIERLLGILQDYLLINKVNMDLDIMDFNILIEETIDKICPLLKEKNIELNLNLVDDEIFINGDYNRLSQVMMNLFKNSIEAINDKNGIINVESKIKGENYRIEIEDNGCGMTKDILSKMKEPFYTTKVRGSGLGVSLIYEIVEAHKGKVKYQSEFGQGTKVILEFPLYNT